MKRRQFVRDMIQGARIGYSDGARYGLMVIPADIKESREDLTLFQKRMRRGRNIGGDDLYDRY